MKPATRLELVIGGLLWAACIPVWIAAFYLACR
jgi:hypothetical protein